MKKFSSLSLYLVSIFTFYPFSVLAVPKYSKNPTLIVDNHTYREHDYKNDDDPHSDNHDWKNHYHSIKSINLKSNGNLKVKFCEKVELIEGQITANNVKYAVDDAYRISKSKKSILWKINESNTFKKGEEVQINTVNFLGRPVENDPNPNELRSLERGCGLAYAFVPRTVEVKDASLGIGALFGLALLVGIGAGAGGSGSGGTSSN